MTTKNLDSKVKKVIKETFEGLSRIQKNKSDNRLIFPTYSNEKLRISEQELRFLFVEKLRDFLTKEKLYYSIETPTIGKYKFTENRKNIKPIFSPKDGKSANFDLVIFDTDKAKRLALIEFKSNNASAHSHAKDFCKLANKEEGDNTTLRYFIEILEKNNKTTIKNLKEEKILKNDWATFEIECPITIACYSLEEDGEIKLSDDDNSDIFYDLKYIDRSC
ncbi:hypothetical protein [Prevotella falsenii]|uniref:hypothetical protein n=1 Tax=Prevotella falsenii TaxID=515414 RepID=UPI000468D74A|nr:hypothetical protein [Prevotella falsenii]